jgi:hypothetical protein
MQAIFHPDIVALDVPMMRKALAKRGITLEFDSPWKRFKLAVAARIEEKKTAAWEKGPEDGERFFRLIVPFSELRMNAYLQVKEGRILVWVLEVGGRMDVPYHLRKRAGVVHEGASFLCSPQRFGTA